MATTCEDIVRRALRKAMGETGTPEGDEAEDALAALQSVILGLPGLLHNARWRDVYADSAYTACEGDRITVSDGATVTLPTTITTCGRTRQPLDLARVQILGGDSPGIWIWSATRGAWAQIDGLSIQDDLPFGEEDVEGLACMLAVRLVDEFGGEVGPATVSMANIAAASFRSRLRRPALPNDNDTAEGFPASTCRSIEDYV
jgi:hypothetical protein